MHHCLTKIELKEIINYKLIDTKIYNNSIKILLKKAENWEISLGCLSYFFSMILEKKLHDGEKLYNLIDDFFHMENSLNIFIQEFDNNFIVHLIRNIREKELTLEDELIRIQTNISEYNYDQSIRF